MPWRREVSESLKQKIPLMFSHSAWVKSSDKFFDIHAMKSSFHGRLNFPWSWRVHRDEPKSNVTRRESWERLNAFYSPYVRGKHSIFIFSTLRHFSPFKFFGGCQIYEKTTKSMKQRIRMVRWNELWILQRFSTPDFTFNCKLFCTLTFSLSIFFRFLLFSLLRRHSKNNYLGNKEKERDRTYNDLCTKGTAPRTAANKEQWFLAMYVRTEAIKGALKHHDLL